MTIIIVDHLHYYWDNESKATDLHLKACERTFYLASLNLL